MAMPHLKFGKMRFLPAAAVGSLVLLSGCGERPAERGTGPARPTFARDVAPIIYENCSYCHRAGQPAPFELLSYEDVNKRAKQISELVGARAMPPWLPEPGFNHFQNERVLTPGQIATITNWVAGGAPVGDAADLPAPPQFTNAWHLGQPDLIVTMPEPFTLPAEGPDVYRNFVIPIPIDRERFVRAMEFRPDNGRVVHHAFFAFDDSGEALLQDRNDDGPGFGGMHLPRSGEVPDSQFFSWQPGKLPMGGDDRRAWRLKPRTALVVQLHLQTTGKPESIQAGIGFYFSPQAGTDVTFKIGLGSYQLDVPPGATNFLAEDAIELPVDVELLAVLPHAHYIAREMQGMATLPDGSSRWLLNIGAWDFNWQGEYWYREPIKLPKGTRVGMRFRYDNSTNNPVNPFNPPRPVSYGLNSSDEMAEMWMIFRLKSAADRMQLNEAVLPKLAAEVITYNRKLLEKDPSNARAWLRVGTALYALGHNEKSMEALRRALQFDQRLDEAQYFLGLIAYDARDFAHAQAAFEAAISINRLNYKAHGYLGLVFLNLQDFAKSESSLLEALRIMPDDPVTQSNLKLVRDVKSGKVPGGPPTKP